MLTRHKFLLVTVKEWLKSVLNCRSYPRNRTDGYPFFGPTYRLEISQFCEQHMPVPLHGTQCPNTSVLSEWVNE